MVEETLMSKSDIQMIREVNVEGILKYIEDKQSPESSYLDCIINYAEEYNLDIDIVGEIVRDSPILLSYVYEEADSMNLVEKIQRLPI